MKHYAITAEVPAGTGDYGSDSITVLNEKVPSEKIVINVARRLADERNTRTMVFVGTDRGRLIWDSLVGKVTEDTAYHFGKPVIINRAVEAILGPSYPEPLPMPTEAETKAFLTEQRKQP